MSFWQEVDGLLLRQAAIQADRIRAAIVESVPVDDIVDRWAEANPNGGTTTPAEARAWAQLNAIIPVRPLKDALDHVYATGWVMGDEASTAAYAHAVTGINKAAPSAQQIKASIGVNWDKWKPGNKPAALLVRPSGAFAALVESGGATVQGINKTIADRMGTLLADSLESGDAYTALSKRLLADKITSKVVKSPLHAEMIAVTEMSRSFNTVAVNNYTNFGVEKVEWLAIDTRSCSICPANMAQGPITLGEAFQSGHINPPAHPHCRCTLIPVVDEGEPMSDEQFAQALMEGKPAPLTPDIGTVAAPALNGPPLPTVKLKDLADAKTNAEAKALLQEVYEGRTFGPGLTLRVDDASLGSGIYMKGTILDKNGNYSGEIQRTFFPNEDKVYHDFLRLGQSSRGKGFASEFSKFSEDWYRAAGIKKIELTAALEDGAYVWAKAGYDWAGKPNSVISKLRLNAEYIRSKPERRGLDAATANDLAARIEALATKLNDGNYKNKNYPKPFQIANFDGPDVDIANADFTTSKVNIGRYLLQDGFWDGVKVL